MIRSKPSSDAYRDAWDRVFADEPVETEPRMAAAPNIKANKWPTEHEPDCPVREDGRECRCPIGNL